MLKSPFQGRSIKCMYVCINVCTSFPGLRERKSCVNTGIEYLPKGMPVLCIVSFALAVRNKRRTQFFSDIWVDIQIFSPLTTIVIIIIIITSFSMDSPTDLKNNNLFSTFAEEKSLKVHLIDTLKREFTPTILFVVWITHYSLFGVSPSE